MNEQTNQEKTEISRREILKRKFCATRRQSALERKKNSTLTNRRKSVMLMNYPGGLHERKST